MSRLEIAFCKTKRRRGKESVTHLFRVPCKEGDRCLCGERRASAETAAATARASRRKGGGQP